MKHPAVKLGVLLAASAVYQFGAAFTGFNLLGLDSAAAPLARSTPRLFGSGALLPATALSDYYPTEWDTSELWWLDRDHVGAYSTNVNEQCGWDICRSLDSVVTVGAMDTSAWPHDVTELSDRILPGIYWNNGAISLQTDGQYTLHGDPHGLRDISGLCAPIKNGINNTIGIAPNSVQAVNLDMSQNQSASALVQSIAWGQSQGIKIYYASYTVPDMSEANLAAISTQLGNDCVLAFAAGNGAVTGGSVWDLYGTTEHQNIVIVGASNRSNERAAYTYYGRLLDVYAPGGEHSPDAEQFYQYNDQNGYGLCTGETSFAAPTVAGALAWIWGFEKRHNPNVTPADCVDILQRSCKPLNTPSENGWGVISLWNAMGRVPNSMAASYGTITGDLSSLYREEGSSVAVTSASLSVDPFRIWFDTFHSVAFSPNTIGELSVRFRASGFSGLAKVYLRKGITTATYEDIGSLQITSSPQTYQVKLVAAPGSNLSQYVGLGNTVSVRLKFAGIGTYSVNLDQVTVRALRASENS